MSAVLRRAVSSGECVHGGGGGGCGEFLEDGGGVE